MPAPERYPNNVCKKRPLNFLRRRPARFSLAPAVRVR